MRAILLAAGFGTRLRPLTNNIPKCLVPINNQPLLDIWLERLNKAGVNSCLVNTHYLSEQVDKYLKNSLYYENVRLSHEETLLGTAATLLNNLDFFQGEDGLLIHADNYCLADLSTFILAHSQRPKECLMTMMTFRTGSPSSCGIVEFDDRNIVISFHEKVEKPPGDIANGAIYILSSELLDILKTDFSMATDFSTQVLPKLVGHIYAHHTNELLIDIGTPEMYERVNVTDH